MQVDNKRNFIINFVYFLIVVLIAYFIFKYAIGFMMPFVLAYIVAAVLRPIVRFISKKTKLNNKLASLFVVVLFYCTIGALIFIICAEAFSFLRDQAMKLPQFYTDTIEPFLKMLLVKFANAPQDTDETLVSMLSGMFEGFSDVITSVLSSLGSLLSTMSTRIVTYLSGVAMSMPSLILKIVFCIVSTFYFTSDYDFINEFLKKQIGEKSYEKVMAVRVAIREIVVSYIRSYAIILSITFVELTVALLILRIKNAVLLALVIAIFDILPVVGTGTILIPWAVIELIYGHYGMAIGLFIAYIVIFVVRNIIEPKIVGKQVGLHPLVTLLAMFVGTTLFGFVGLFGLPITMALIVDLNEKGLITLYKNVDRLD